jgi:hypothetical protein
MGVGDGKLQKLQKNISKQFKKLNLVSVEDTSKIVSKIQENIDSAVAPIQNISILNGVLLKSISLLSSQDNLVEHKLNREPIGFIVVRKRSQSTVWDDNDNNNMKNKFLLLKCSSDVVVDLWIF